MLDKKFASPLYVAVMECPPPPSADVENAATLLLIGVLPNTVTPSWKVTVPVAVEVGEKTVAVNVTTWPTLEGFSEETTLVEVAACVPVPVRGTEVVLPGVLSGRLRLALPGPVCIGEKATFT